MNILVINGPNLNLLGRRNTELYGHESLKELNKHIKANYKNKKKVNIDFFQTNSEGEIIDKIHSYVYSQDVDGVVLNPGAYGHYSYAIRDAIEAVNYPVIEVHITNVLNREDFRKKLVLSDVCEKVILGKGTNCYIEAIDYLLSKK